MKKVVLIVLCSVFMLCAGCSNGIPQEEYDRVVQERDVLVTAVDEYGEAMGITELSKSILGGSSSGLGSENLGTEEKPSTPSIPLPKYELGETAPTKNFNVTFVDFFTKSRVNTSKYSYYSPDEGFIYGVLVFELENKTAESIELWPASDFEYYADNALVDGSILGYTPPAINGYTAIESETELAAGRKIKGYVIADIPVGTNELEIEFDGATFRCTVNAG